VINVDAVWTRRQLRAALWALHVLGPEGETEEIARESWLSLPLAGTVDVPELEAATSALVDAGLIARVDGRLVADRCLHLVSANPFSQSEELLLAVLLDRNRPLWLTSAAGDGDHLAPELVPSEAAFALSTVIPDPAKREAFLLNRARTIDSQQLHALGSAGEEAVFELCTYELMSLGSPELATLVTRVSLISDELGYDVTAPCLSGGVRRMEVKATRSLGSTITVIITRNELETGQADPSWSLVIVRVGHDASVVLGWTIASALEPLLPVDRDVRGRWQAARLRLTLDLLTPGLPPADDRPVLAGLVPSVP
jgi:hypothetical protein